MDNSDLSPKNKQIPIDDFVQKNMPSTLAQADYVFELPDLDYPKNLNLVDDLIDKNLTQGRSECVALRGEFYQWTYAELNKKVNQIANLLTLKYSLVTGNRVLIRGKNNPYLAAIWLATIKAGLVAVTTMPLLRARDLKPVIDKAKVNFIVCQDELIEEVEILESRGQVSNKIIFSAGDDSGQLNQEIKDCSADFQSAGTKSTDAALIAFTSGTTGNPKGCVHYHRDVLSMAICFSENVLKPTSSDIFAGSPPLAFTFGLGSLLVFPLYVGASALLLENATPLNLAEAIQHHEATLCFTSPTGYNMMLDNIDDIDLKSLRMVVAAGEHLPAKTYTRWLDQVGIPMINGIGSTEMIHIFASTTLHESAPGLTGSAVPGYEVTVMDQDLKILGPGNEGLLAVRGPTGCKYLNDDRQEDYVVNGWNLTGDVCYLDAQKKLWYLGRSDDMIVSSGYNISSIEVETVINEHEAVAESAVIGVDDAKRGKLIKAFVVLRQGYQANSATELSIQYFVRSEASPHKYPREIEFIDALPRTETGKLQRFKLFEHNTR